MRALTFLLAGLISFAPICGAKEYNLSSPDGKTRVSIEVNSGISCEITKGGVELVSISDIDLFTDLTDGYKVKRVRTGAHHQELCPVVCQKTAVIDDNCNFLEMEFAGGRKLQWRAYDNGVAYRWCVTSKTPFRVKDECAKISFPEETEIWYPAENNGFYSANEQKFTRMPLKDLEPGRLASLPVLYGSGESKILITESDLLDYAGMWMVKDQGLSMKAVFPKYPKCLRKSGDRDEFVEEREDWIASYQSGTTFPWRIIAIADEDKQLLTNTLVYQLASPAEGDWSWVRPGKVQWDWWHDLNLTGVDFKAGLNTET